VTGSLGRRYARALLAIARENGTLERTGEELARVTATLTSPEVRSVVTNPALPLSKRRGLVERIVARCAVAPAVGNLVRLLADRDRLGILPDVERAFGMLLDGELGRTRVHVRSATSLDDGEVTQVRGLAEKLAGSSTVLLTTEVDSTLLGGVVLNVGGKVYDGSVKTQLARLARHMAGERA
jgi:F-type H+-transporting ATPase subunit delta